MTNSEKFVEVMNKYFDAGLTKKNLLVNDVKARPCTPCGIFRKGACRSFSCSKCADWWDKEWKSKGGASKSETILPIPCTKVKEKTVKDWFLKINEELDELKEMIIICCPMRDNVTDVIEHKVTSLDKTKLCERIGEEAADTITAITSMLEAMGIDENMRQAAQRRVNEKNKERGRF